MKILIIAEPADNHAAAVAFGLESGAAKACRPGSYRRTSPAAKSATSRSTVPPSGFN
jgi:hypothetical protein